MNSSSTPHYLLFSESSRPASRGVGRGTRPGQWRFVLESLHDSEKLEVSDEESGLDEERLELLAVVRGLEALPQPSKVTLVTASRYVSRGLRFGLEEWRENGWQWESFGQWSPVKNADLWQRLDRALSIHEVQCRTWRFDLPHRETADDAATEAESRQRVRPPHFLQARKSLGNRLRGEVRRAVDRVRESLSQGSWETAMATVK